MLCLMLAATVLILFYFSSQIMAINHYTALNCAESSSQTKTKHVFLYHLNIGVIALVVKTL